MTSRVDEASAPGAVEVEDVVLETTDGFPLAATLHRPPSAPRFAVLVSGATGVRRRYYRAFADRLAARGALVMTYDFRGIGDSRDARGRWRAARMRDWGERDMAACIDRLDALAPDAALLAVGHSGGGWLFGLAPNNRRVRALFAVGTQNGCWRHWPGLRGKAFMFWTMFVAIPLVTRLVGRLPGALLGGDALPRGVALQWAFWCRGRDFVREDDGTPLREHYRGYDGRIRLTAISDDGYAPESAVRALVPLFANAEVDVRVLHPHGLGLAALGHFGYFRRSTPVAAWDEAFDWLAAQAQSRRS